MKSALAAVHESVPGPEPDIRSRLSLEALDDLAKMIAGSREMLVWYRRDAQKKPRSSGSRPYVPGRQRGWCHSKRQGFPGDGCVWRAVRQSQQRRQSRCCNAGSFDARLKALQQGVTLSGVGTL